jgi:hypothetical protein
MFASLLKSTIGYSFAAEEETKPKVDDEWVIIDKIDADMSDSESCPEEEPVDASVEKVKSKRRSKSSSAGARRYNVQEYLCKTGSLRHHQISQKTNISRKTDKRHQHSMKKSRNCNAKIQQPMSRCNRF